MQLLMMRNTLGTLWEGMALLGDEVGRGLLDMVDVTPVLFPDVEELGSSPLSTLHTVPGLGNY